VLHHSSRPGRRDFLAGAAAFVAASRVIGDHHYLSDVVTGAVIGRFHGLLVTANP